MSRSVHTKTQLDSYVWSKGYPQSHGFDLKKIYTTPTNMWFKFLLVASNFSRANFGSSRIQLLSWEHTLPHKLTRASLIIHHSLIIHSLIIHQKQF